MEEFHTNIKSMTPESNVSYVIRKNDISNTTKAYRFKTLKSEASNIERILQ